MRLAPPLDPDAPEARRWLEEELAKTEYRSAEPNAFDRAVQSALDWFFGLFDGATGVSSTVGIAIVIALVLALLVVGLLVYGMPRLRRRRRGPVVFGGVELENAAHLRRSAEAAAGQSDWALAIEERFRAVIRTAVDRDLVAVHPGTTAHGFADAASRALVDLDGALANALAEAASVFDQVRYLGGTGDASSYRHLVALDTAMSAAIPVQPALEPATAPGAEPSVTS